MAMMSTWEAKLIADIERYEKEFGRSLPDTSFYKLAVKAIKAKYEAKK